jgi:phosphoglycolate phosphatase
MGKSNYSCKGLLDGTLTDPKVGITKSIQYSLRKLGRPIIEQNDLLWCIGPPLLESFKVLLETDNSELAQKAIEYYRERFAEKGVFENRVYDDIKDLLNGLTLMDISLYVASSKPEVFVTRIIDHFDLTHYFKGVYGSRLNGELANKADLIKHILTKENLDSKTVIMIGDRKHDIIGAKKAGVKSIAVTYGYGSQEELFKVNPDHIADTVLDILSIVKIYEK